MCWSMESQKYDKAAIDTIKALLLEDGRELKNGQVVGTMDRCLPATVLSWMKRQCVTKIWHLDSDK